MACKSLIFKRKSLFPLRGNKGATKGNLQKIADSIIAGCLTQFAVGKNAKLTHNG